MANNNPEKGNENRRKFLRLGLMSSVSAFAGASLISNLAPEEDKSSGEKERVLTPDGTMMEGDAASINKYP